MSDAKWAEVWVRADDHVQRLAAALIREEVEFRIKPEPNGWWEVRAKVTRRYPIGGDRLGFGADDLQALEQSTRLSA